MKPTPLEKAVDILGGQTALAKAISRKPAEVKQGHVWAWLHRIGKVPAEFCIAIEEATGGKVTRYQLRADVFGAAPSDAKAIA